MNKEEKTSLINSKMENDSIISQLREVANTRRVAMTLPLYAAFFCVASIYGLFGPTMQYLMRSFCSTTEQISYVFAARATGNVIGSMLGGIVIDQFIGKDQLLMSIYLAVAATGQLIVPWLHNINALYVTQGVATIATASASTGANILLLRIWGIVSPPFMHGLHFTFGVGSLVSPLIASAFLSNDASSQSKSFLSGDSSLSQNLHGTVIQHLSMETPNLIAQLCNSSMDRESANLRNLTGVWFSHDGYSYIVPAAIVFFTSLVFLQLYVTKYSITAFTALTDKKVKKDSADIALKTILIIGISIYFFLYVGTEVAYAQYIATFSIREYNFSESKAALLTATFWGAFTVGRAVAIPLSIFKSATVTLVGFMSMAIGASTCLLLTTLFHMQAICIWPLTAGLGFSMAPIFPTGILWIEEQFLVTGTITGVFLVCSACGQIALPLLMGYFFDHLEPISMMYLNLFCVVICTVIFGLLYAIIKYWNNLHPPPKVILSPKRQSNLYDFKIELVQPAPSETRFFTNYCE